MVNLPWKGITGGRNSRGKGTRSMHFLEAKEILDALYSSFDKFLPSYT
jgi:hypothetical protein